MHRGPALAAAVALLALAGPPRAPRPAEAAPPRTRVVPVVLAERPEDVAGLPRRTPLPDDGALHLAGGTVAFALDAAGALSVDADGKGAPKTRVASGRVATVAVRREGAPPLPLALVFDREEGGVPGAWPYRVASALRVVAGERSVVLVDCDGDGSVAGARDGVWPSGAHLMTVRRPLPPWDLVAADVRWSLGGLDLGKADAAVAMEPALPVGAKDGDDPVGATLARVNRFRRRTGLPEVDLDPALSAACAKHLAYVKTNGWDPRGNAHMEDPAKPGYTQEGHAAAVASLLAAYDGPAAVDLWARTYYHRAPLMVPGCERIGIATSPGFTVVDFRRGVAPAPHWAVPFVRSPSPGETEVPPAFWRGEEVPCPVPRCGARGNAVVVLGLPGTASLPRAEAVTLTHARWGAVPVLVPAPDPTGSYPLLGGAVPSDPLASGRYEAVFTPSRPGAAPVRWTFVVGK